LLNFFFHLLGRYQVISLRRCYYLWSQQPNCWFVAG